MKMRWHSKTRLIAFDMDGTLIDLRVIEVLADTFGFSGRLRKILRQNSVAYHRSRRIAYLMKGIQVLDFIRTVKGITLTQGTRALIRELRNRKFIIGIISDSYSQATEIIANKLKLDFHVSNKLEVKNGTFTGKIEMPMGWQLIQCKCQQSVCKDFHLRRVAKRYGVNLADTVAVGDSRGDKCMMSAAGTAIWFNPKDRRLIRSKHHVAWDNLLNIKSTLLEIS